MLQRHRHNYPVLNELENSPSGSNVLKALLMLSNSRVSVKGLDLQDELKHFWEELASPLPVPLAQILWEMVCSFPPVWLRS